MIDPSRFTVIGSDLDGIEVLCHDCTRVERVMTGDWPTLADLIAWAHAHAADDLRNEGGASA